MKKFIYFFAFFNLKMNWISHNSAFSYKRKFNNIQGNRKNKAGNEARLFSSMKNNSGLAHFQRTNLTGSAISNQRNLGTSGQKLNHELPVDLFGNSSAKMDGNLQGNRDFYKLEADDSLKKMLLEAERNVRDAVNVDFIAKNFNEF